MRPSFYCLLALITFHSVSNAQNKTPLPGDYFDKYSYTLSSSLDSADPDLLKPEIVSIAKTFLSYANNLRKCWMLNVGWQFVGLQQQNDRPDNSTFNTQHSTFL